MKQASQATTNTESSAKRSSNTQHAVTELKKMIVQNQLAAGSNHLESELAELLGMSRTPIREAGLILESQGLVEIKPRHGMRVRSLSPEDMAEIYDVLTELESLSAERAAQKKYTKDELEIARSAITDMDEALKIDDLRAWAESDDLFHAELVRLGGNQRVTDIFNMYNDQVRRARTLTLQLRPKPVKSNDAHREVLKAIRKGNGKKARKLHRVHRLEAKEMLVDLLKRHGLHNI